LILLPQKNWQAIRRPEHAYTFFLELLGRPFEDPVVDAYRQRFPHLGLERDERRGTVCFKTE
jgi:hypoxia up-regulated 1